MPSIIEGYTYDIFISYRQNDNKYDGWVTEFVDNFNKELEANIKDKISVYFDINPQDGLLETDSVDKSLEDKLKCLIFIPIISRTYCDSKSFAWQHEFCTFNKLAKEDKFGRDIRLTSGNVASRILPIKIHDLDPEDKTLIENELGGVLRGIEFIYKEAGVNRPLKPNDDAKENLYRTQYRNQVNKVANAVKEIISALKKQSQHPEEVSKQEFKVKPALQKNLKAKIIIVSFLLLSLLVLGYFFIPKLFKSSELVEKTIAVLPFRNLSNDSTQLYFCEGFAAEILNNLQKVQSFTLRSRTSTDQYRNTQKSSTTIGNELNVNYLVEGIVGREGNELKIWVQLIDVKADKPTWSNDYTREMKQIFALQSEIAKEIASELKAVLTPEEIKKIDKKPTENSEAYNYYLQGNFYYLKNYVSGDNGTAIELYEKAIGLDPGFSLAYVGIAKCLLNQYWLYKDHSEDVLLKSKKAIDKAFEIDPALPDAHLALGIYYYYGYLEYQKALEQFEIVLKDQPKNSDVIYWSAHVHRRAGDWEMAKSCYVKAFELNPRSSQIAMNTGETLDLIRDYSEAEEFYNMSIMLQPDGDYPYLLLSREVLRRDGNTKKAREILENAARNNKYSVSDSMVIETNIFIDIYDGSYEEALKDISLFKYDVVQTQFYFRPKYLYDATIYGLMNMPELEHAYYDSARIFLESRIANMSNDQRLYGSLGIAYAGLGFDEKAINAGKKAVKLLPISKEAYRGVYPVEDLALIYVMVGEYDKAIEQIKYLLLIPGFLSTKILELDPRWAPLKNHPEFNKILE